MTPLTEQEIKEARALCEKATPNLTPIMALGAGWHLGVIQKHRARLIDDRDSVEWACFAANAFPRALSELAEMRKPCVWTLWGDGLYRDCKGFRRTGNERHCPNCGHRVEVKT